MYEAGTPDYSGTSKCNKIEYTITNISLNAKICFSKISFLFKYFDSKRYAHHYTKEIMSKKSAYVVANHE